jgi:hypothetical protein
VVITRVLGGALRVPVRACSACARLYPPDHSLLERLYPSRGKDTAGPPESATDTSALHALEEKVRLLEAQLRSVSTSDATSDATSNPPIVQAGSKECIVCMDRKACMALIDCGHTGFCATCAIAHKDRPCPVCRAVVRNVLKLY